MGSYFELKNIGGSVHVDAGNGALARECKVLRDQALLENVSKAGRKKVSGGIGLLTLT